MELVTQTPKMRVYRTDSAQQALEFAAMYNGTYWWEATDINPDGYWVVSLD